MKHIDLFGNLTEMETEPKKIVGYIQKYRKDFHYRLGTDKECCEYCKHSCYTEASRRYYKCRLQSLNASESSDIRLKNVCNNFLLEE